MRLGNLVRSAPLWAALLVSGAAFGQAPITAASFELERLSLNPDGEGSLLLGTGALLPAGSYRATALVHYERNPLSFIQEGQRLAPVVSDRVTAHLMAAYAPFNWLEVALQLPVVMFQTGADLSPQYLARPASFGLGTPVVSARVAVLSQRGASPVDLALELGAGLPIGSADALGRDPSFRLEPKVMVGRDLGGLRAGLEAGVLLRTGEAQALTPWSTNIEDLVGNEIRGGLSLSTTGTGLRGEVDLRGAIALSSQPSQLELLAGLRYPIGGAEILGLAGVGFGSMPGTPLFRVLAGVAFGNAPPAPARLEESVTTTAPRCVVGQPHDPADCPDLDDDGDGVRNAADKCPTEPGPAVREGCPVQAAGPAAKDTDKDGVPDAQDRCPTEPGPASRQGCPFKDSDGDGIDDSQDRCPNQPGPMETRGCPKVAADADKDGVPDAQDKCPNQAGPASNQGCPVVEKPATPTATEKLEIRGKVMFDNKKSKLQKKWQPLLDQVAKVLVAHPEIRTVTLDGFTDDREPNAQKLSLARAEAVRRYLIDKGVSPDRLVAKGYGAERPLDTSKKGRKNNRRVEFLISTEQTDTMEAPKR